MHDLRPPLLRYIDHRPVFQAVSHSGLGAFALADFAAGFVLLDFLPSLTIISMFGLPGFLITVTLSVLNGFIGLLATAILNEATLLTADGKLLKWQHSLKRHDAAQ